VPQIPVDPIITSQTDKCFKQDPIMQHVRCELVEFTDSQTMPQGLALDHFIYAKAPSWAARILADFKIATVYSLSQKAMRTVYQHSREEARQVWAVVIAHTTHI
jgi:hypothetical protein